MNRRSEIRIAWASFAVLTLTVTIQPAAAALVGPAFPPPGGVTYSFSGLGAGEAGGATIHFSDIDETLFQNLYWGAWDNLAVRAKMDSTDDTFNDSGPFQNEVLDFDAMQSNLANGIARWSGGTELPTAFGNLPIAVRFTLTVLDSTNAPAPLTTASVSGLPSPNFGALDILAIPGNGDFSANLLFEARREGDRSAVWAPFNEVFDTLIDANNGYCPGCANTHFYGAFFFESVPAPDPSDTQVPEPAALALFASGLLGLGAMALRKRRRS